MAVLKCKMCGGDIILSEDKTFGTCDSCGSTMTFPKVSDEHKLNLYNRANHFRRQNEFDKAIAAYDKILDQDDTDAEAHWGAVLSRYGIEYVEDPVSHERIPTCHRVQAASILSDPDYLSALEYAPDAASRSLYEQEARRIAEIQKGILAISSQEKPYDVFICYKETDDSGRRTKDSALAQEIYYQLTNEGYKVFFSRITLEDKLGQEYEPYIFAALNSARVMLVIGTRPEYFNAVWVKNEWSRYLALMKTDRSRLLIPCYRDMDPYDLPEELSALQSQDMSKIGFNQDLIRGIKKVLDSKKQPEAKAAPQPAPAASNVENLMKRVRLFMEDGDFHSANEYLDKVLDENAEYAPAYIAKVCTALGFRKESDLGEATFLYADHPDWKKALRFATPQQKATYESYAEKVKARVKSQIRQFAFDCAVEMAVYPGADRKKLEQELEQYKASCETYENDRASGSRRKNALQNMTFFRKAVADNEPGSITKPRYEDAAKLFDAIGDEEADQCAEACTKLAEQARQRAIYLEAKPRVNNSAQSASQLEQLAKQFLSIPDYKDAKELAQDCQEKADIKRTELYETAIIAMQNAEKSRSSQDWKLAYHKLDHEELVNYQDVPQLLEQAKRRIARCEKAEAEAMRRAAAKKRRNTILVILVFVLAITAYFVITKVMIPKSHYDKGVSLRASKQWSEAIVEFQKAGDYSDSAEQIYATCYEAGVVKRDEKDWETAVVAFGAAGDYKDANQQILATRYAEGEFKRAQQDWDGAVEAFEKAKTTNLTETNYGTTIPENVWYRDANDQILATRYAEGIAKREAKDWIGAVEAFKMAGDYVGAAEQVIATYNFEGAAKLADGDWNGAVTAFTNAGNYEQVSATFYAEGEALRTAKEWDAAIDAFVKAGDYRDAKEQIKETFYQQAEYLKENNQWMSAFNIYKTLGDYKDSYDRAYSPYYNWGIKSRDDNKDWDTAVIMFEAAGEYKDVKEQILITRYAEGEAKRAAQDWDGAAKAFEQAGTYSDAATQILATRYAEGEAKRVAKDWDGAAKAFVQARTYSDAATQILATRYAEGEAKRAAKDWDGAAKAFGQAGNYKDTTEQIMATRYAEGETKFAAQDWDGAVKAFEQAGDYKDAKAKTVEALAKAFEKQGRKAFAALYYSKSGNKAKAFSLWAEAQRSTVLAAGNDNTVALKSDGTVVTVGKNDLDRYKVRGWQDIVTVAAGQWHTVGLKSDGKVVAVGWNYDGQCNVTDWQDIVAVTAGYGHTVGLKSEGTVVAVGSNDFGQCNVSGWRDIVAVAAHTAHTVGLKSDGTVVAMGWNDEGHCNVSSWRDIVAVATGEKHTVGLKSDGTVVAVGNDAYGQRDVSDWRDIVAVAVGDYHTIGLKSDGTVVAVGRNDEGQCNVSSWRDIVVVAAGYYHTVGLKLDGTVVTAGKNDDGQCDVSSWSGIKFP